ncbi:MAG: type II secretion system minor pseudopilin GspJ [Gammaproteobacteria bacterium]|nr:type II secretion system minor pseudopilin GspJ [Gammaproteobacteria bacterium]
MTEYRDRRPPWASGFTLLELLVAMAIFALMGALALGGLNNVLGQREAASRQLERLHRVQRAVRILATDFGGLAPRVARDALGTGEGPLVAPCGVEFTVCLSRDGWRNPFAQFARGTLQRVQYRLEDDRLLREYWPVMDRTLVNEPHREVLVDHVERFEIAYVDRSGSGDWLTQWPPLQQAGSTGLPLAVRFTLTLQDWGEIVRIIEVVQ